jgi:HEPN domain-containing protein
MKPRERFAPDDPREWLNRVRSNLARAQTKITGVYLEDLYFDAQQAAKKAVKALLIKRGVTFPYVHDLARLVTLLEQARQVIPELVRQSEALTRYAVVTCYPGLAEPVTEAHYQEALVLAKAVLEWVKTNSGAMHDPQRT